VIAPPALLAAVAIATAVALTGVPARAGALLRPAETYRADGVSAVPAGRPEGVDLLLPQRAAWPDAVRAEFAERVRAEWREDLAYGAVHATVGVWLDYPLVTARAGRHVVVPVVESEVIEIAGRLQLEPERDDGRRVILLLDASSSANQRTRFENPDGSVEQITVLEAEHRAIEHLLELLDDDWLEFGIIAFGESTWPVVEPGASAQTVRARLADFRREHPRGEGRTDTVCALATAIGWLEHTPAGISREVVLLTDGDLPHSGRFLDCSRGGREARERCEARRNRTPCPASGRWHAGRRSDEVQLARMGRRHRRSVRVSPVVFEPDRRARPYRVLAENTGGQFVQVPSAQGIEVALPPLVGGRIHGVFARNVRTGVETDDLLTGDVTRFSGALGLAAGANDIELRVESDRGTAALLRFRVYGAKGHLARVLEDLREANRALEQRAEQLTERARVLAPERRERELEVRSESLPAAPDDGDD